MCIEKKNNPPTKGDKKQKQKKKKGKGKKRDL